MLWLLVLFSSICLLLSAVVHISTFFGIDPNAETSIFWLLHLFVFIAIIGGAYFVDQAVDGDKHKHHLVIKSSPAWLKYLTGAFFVYGIFNFTVFLALSEGTPDYDGARYSLQDHGNFIREITEQEFHQAQALVARGFSGHWMLFYSLALLLLIGAYRYHRAKGTNIGA